MNQELVWSTEIETDAQNRWQRVRLILSQQGLGEALLGTASPSIVRSASPTGGQSLLILSDVITLEGGLVAMNVLAAREANDTLAIEARITSEQQLPIPLRATLQCGGQLRTATVDAGHALFTGLPIHSLVDLDTNRALTDLRIAIERG